MAEAYRGLTIRIGGDTTKLTKALKAANGAASQTQAELRKVGQALRLDPDNVKAYNTQLGLVSEQATNASMKLATLADVQKQLSDSPIVTKAIGDSGHIEEQVTTIEELLDKVRELEGISKGGSVDVGRRLGTAQTGLASVTASLNSAHRELTDLVKDAKGVEVEKLKLAFDLTSGKKSIDEVALSLSRLKDGTERSAKSVSTLVAQIEQMSKKLAAAYDSGSKTVDREEITKALADIARNDLVAGVDMSGLAISEMVDRMTAEGTKNPFSRRNVFARDFTSEVFSEKNGNTSQAIIEETYRSIASDLDLSDEMVENLIADVKRLATEFVAAESEIDKWKVIARFEDLNNEILKGEAQVKNYAKMLADIDAESEFMRGDSKNFSYGYLGGIKELIDAMPDLKANVKVLDDAFKELMSIGDTVAGSFTLDDSNLKPLETAMQSYASAELVAVEQFERLKSEMETYDVGGYGQWSENAMSLAQALYDASSAAEVAAQDVARLDGQIASLEDKQAKLRGGRTATTDKDEASVLEENERQLESIGEAIGDLNKKRREARETERLMQEQLEELRRHREYEELSAQVEEARQRIAAAHEKLVEFNQTLAVKAQFGNLDEVNDLGADIATATNRANLLREAVRLDPSNTKLTEAAMQALAEVESLVEKRTKEINEQLDGVDTSDMDSLREEYGSLEGAVRETAKEAALLGANLTEARVSLSDLIRDNGLEEFRDELNDVTKPLDDSTARTISDSVGTKEAYEELLRIRELIADLTPQYDSASSKSANAAVLRQYEDLVSSLAATSKSSLANITVGLDFDVTNGTKELQDKLREIGSDVAQSMPDVVIDMSSTDNAIKETLANAKSMFETLKGGAFDEDAYDIAFRQLNEAMDSSIARAGNLSEILDGYSASGVDEAAKGIENITLNAARAEAAMKQANAAVEDAKSLYDELEKKRSDAIGSGDLGDVAEYNEQIREAKEDYDRLAEAAREATEAFNAAKAAKEMADYRKQMAQVKSEIEEIAERQLELNNASTKAKVFGDTSELDELADELDKALKKVKGIREEMQSGGNKDGLSEDLKKAKDNVDVLLAEYEKLSQAIFGAFDANGVTDSLVAKYGSLSMAIIKSKNEYKDLSVKISESKSEMMALLKEAGIDGGGSGFDELGALIEESGDKLDSELKDKLLDLIATLKDFESAQREAFDDSAAANLARAFEDAEQEASVMRKSVSDASKSGTGGDSDSRAAFVSACREIGQEARQAANKIVESATTIDASYRDMRKTVDATEQQFESLREEAIRFSQTHAVSADQILEMEALGGQLGIAASDLQQFGELASNLTIATDIDADNVALQLGQISNIMSDLDDMDSIERFGDALVRLGNNAAAQESSIMNVAQRIAAVANVTSMSSAQVLGWSAAIAETGMRSESAATAIVNTIEGIGNAVNAGGTDLEQFAKIAGMSAEEFSSAWENSSSEALQRFVEGLENLTDDSTAAIAALDSVGISSVRQETALLALSQTVDNLTGNIAMAESAFRTGGDAAKEAQNKSEGISGSVAILENNINVLAATLGESLKPAVDLASSAVRALTSIMELLGPQFSGAIVGVGGIAAVVGTAVPIIQEFSKGWRSIVEGNSPAMLLALKSGVDDFVTALKTMLVSTKDMAVSFTGAIASGEGLGAACAAAGTSAAAAAAGFKALVLSIAPLAAITAAIAAIGMIVDAYSEWREHVETVDKATRGLTESVNAAGPAYDDYAGSVKRAAKSINDLREASDDAITSQAQLAESLTERWEDVGVNAAIVDEYAKTIDELTGKQRLNQEEQARLTAAVEGYNEMTGQTVSVLDAEKGELDTSTEAILENAKAWKERAESEAAYEMYKDVLKQRIKDEIALEDVMAQLDATTAQYTNTSNKYYVQSASVTGAVSDLKRQEQELKASISACDKTMALYLDHMMTTDSTLAQVERALNSAGDSLDNYKSLTDDDLAEISKAWVGSGTVDEIIAKIKELNDAKQEASETSGVMRAPTDEEVKAYKEEQAKKYEAEKRIRDDYYTKRQRELADEYEAEKQLRDDYYDDTKLSYDKEYNALKDTYDKEYNAKKKQLEKDYNATKDTRDKEYNATKKSFDKIYNARKDELTKEYNAAKKSFEKAYNARKDALDKEYNAAKDASDKYLKSYKKALEDQVDAFKDATDQRVKEIEREYDAKKKLLENEYSGYDSDIDKRIKAIEDEQDAEDKALEEAERKEKLAELGKAVEEAKTDKKREEAEKALQDYKDQLAREDVKAQREAQKQILNDQKDALKDQLSDRKDHLEETYDAVKESYKDQREAQLKAIEDANDEAYDAEKDAEDAKLELLKDSHKSELEMLKDSQELELEAMKDANSLELEELKDDHEKRLEQIKDENDKELEEIKDRNDIELEKLKDSHSALLEEKKDWQTESLKNLKNGHERELELIKRKQDDELTQLKRFHEDELTEIKSKLDREYELYKKGGDEAVNAARAAEEAAAAAGEDTGKAIPDGVTKGINEKSGETHVATRKFTGDLMNDLNDGLTFWKPSGKKGPTDLAIGVEEAAGEAKSRVDNAIGSMFDLTKFENIKSSAKEDGKDVPTSTADGVEEAAAESKPRVDGAMSSLFDLTKFENIKSSARDGGKDVPLSVAAGEEETVDVAKAPADNLLEYLTGLFVPENMSVGEAGGAALMNDLGTSISSNTDNPKQASKGAKTEVINALKAESGETDPAARSLMNDLAASIGSNSDKPIGNAKKVFETISKTADISKPMGTYGANAATTFNNEFMRNAQTLLQNAQTWATNMAKTVKNSLGIHSPSREFKWIADMLFAGFNQGWESGEESTLRTAKRTASSISDAFSSDMTGFDPTLFDEDALASNMERMQVIVRNGFDEMYAESREAMLRQADMMQDVMSKCFDPTQTVDAAYEAIGKINAGELRLQQQVASAQSVDNSTYAPVINISIPEVVVREEADIERLSNQIAIRVQRSLNARIG